MNSDARSGTGHRAVVTLAIGREGRELLDLSGPFMERYAARIGAEFVAITERRIRHRLQWRKPRVNLHLEKFQIGDLLVTFDRILYLDADILVLPHAPDFFALAAPEELGVVTDPGEENAWKRAEEMAAIATKRGNLPSPASAYFNAGVLLLSRAHRELLRFDPAKLVPGRWPDQTYMNYESARQSLPRRYLDSRANFLPGAPGWEDPATRRAAWAVHYAGEEAKPLMKADAAFLAQPAGEG
jgi:hypothetical protein